METGECSGNCLECEHPQGCLDEKPHGRALYRMEIRHEQVIQLKAQGLGTGQVAQVLNVSKRTIQRAMKGT